jgi:hypothetical protein
VAAEHQEIALLRILIACGEKAIEAFHASNNLRDAELLSDLERVVARSRDELAVLSNSGTP